MTAILQDRVLAGVPHGGRFAAAGRRPAAATALAPAPGSDRLWDRLDSLDVCPGASEDPEREPVRVFARCLIGSMPWLGCLDEAAGPSDGGLAVAEAAASAVGVGGAVPHRVDVVQGMDRPTADVSSHYGLLVQMDPGAAPLVVDFAYSHMDPSAAFPLVATPQEWSYAVGQGSAAEREGRRALARLCCRRR